MKSNLQWKLVVGALLVGIALVSPASAGNKEKVKVDLTRAVWPAPPEIGRIKLLGAYTGQDIEGVKKQGLLERLAGVPDATSRTAFKKPSAIAVDSKGRAYVTDSLLRVVFVMDVEKRTLAYRGDKPPASFKKPVGVAVDAQDRLFVSDADSQNITAFEANGEVITVFGEKELQKPCGMAIDPALNVLYVTDIKLRKVAVYDLATFKFLRWIGRSIEEKIDQSEANKLLMSPTSVTVDPDGLIYVVDTFANRIKVFDQNGDFVRNFGTIGAGPGQFMRPRGIAVDADGHIYVSDALANHFVLFNSSGQPLMPVGIEGTYPGQFMVPADIAIDNFNRIWIADQVNRRVQVFRYVTDEEADAERAKSGKGTKTTQVADAKGNKK